ncbi:MAG: hypothetical protein ABL878_19110, partial [Burkholderiales bacterium]
SGDYPEKFSTIPPIIKTVEKKKNEREWFSAKAEDEKGSAKTPIEPGIKTAHQQGTLPPASEQENEQINIAPGPAAGGGVLARARGYHGRLRRSEALATTPGSMAPVVSAPDASDRGRHRYARHHCSRFRGHRLLVVSTPVAHLRPRSRRGVIHQNLYLHRL